MTASKIEWTDNTWSPWLGCRKVSEGCANCYIVTTTPFRTRKLLHGAERSELSIAYWKQPLKWERAAAAAGVRVRVFPSLCDWLDDEVQVAWLARFLDLVFRTPHLDWQLLTKRPQNWRGRLCRALDHMLCSDRQFPADSVAALNAWLMHRPTPPANVWVGASTENHNRAVERIPLLLDIPAAVRFLSCEPLIGPIDFYKVSGAWLDQTHPWTNAPVLHGIDFVIVGGESDKDGKSARPMHPEWVRTIRNQCAETHTAFFFKQWGEWLPGEEHHTGPEWKFQNGSIVDSHWFPDFNENPPGWATDYHSVRGSVVVWKRVGKVKAGRQLDGQVHSGLPVLPTL